jgi:hypothetical protein
MDLPTRFGALSRIENPEDHRSRPLIKKLVGKADAA